MVSISAQMILSLLAISSNTHIRHDWADATASSSCLRLFVSLDSTDYHVQNWSCTNCHMVLITASNDSRVSCLYPPVGACLSRPGISTPCPQDFTLGLLPFELGAQSIMQESTLPSQWSSLSSVEAALLHFFELCAVAMTFILRRPQHLCYLASVSLLSVSCSAVLYARCQNSRDVGEDM